MQLNVQIVFSTARHKLLKLTYSLICVIDPPVFPLQAYGFGKLIGREYPGSVTFHIRSRIQRQLGNIPIEGEHRGKQRCDLIGKNVVHLIVAGIFMLCRRNDAVIDRKAAKNIVAEL